MSSEKLAFIDLETTGTDPKRHCAWEFGVVMRTPGGVEREYEWQVEADISTADPRALAVGHWYERRAVIPLSGRVVAPNLARVLAGSVLVGINIWFDRDFTEAFLRANNEALVADYHMVEICSLVTGYLHGFQRAQGVAGSHHVLPRSRSSNELAKAIGIDPNSYDRHSALADARFARDIYDKVTKGGHVS